MVLNERYRLVRPLARGGMGSVWRAEHLTLFSEVAIKIIDPAIAHLEMGLSRFLREARALAALHSPYIVQVIDFGSQGEVVYLVMELLEGWTLGQRLKAEGRLSPAETCRILSDVCKAMSHAHDHGMVHRDLKPDNIFLCDERRERVTKVLDFGIAKPKDLGGAGNTDTSAGTFLGTPSYMSPEQCRGQVLDQRSDLWALGAIAYECLVGQRLFAGDVVGDVVLRICSDDLPLAAAAKQLPPGFVGWLERALARDPGQRFQSAGELMSALSAALGGAARPERGVDAAETISAPMPAQELFPASGATSTLAHGTVEKSARRSEGLKRAPVALAVGGLLVALTLVVLLRDRPEPGSTAPGNTADAPPEVAPSSGASRSATSPERVPEVAKIESHTQGHVATTERRGLRGPGPDAGVLAGPARERRAAQRPPARRATETAEKPAKRGPPAQGTALEMEQLRKRR
jgi:serine/threonine-protein kinase